MVVILKNTYPNILSKVKSQAADIQKALGNGNWALWEDRIVKWLVARLWILIMWGQVLTLVCTNYVTLDKLQNFIGLY